MGIYNILKTKMPCSRCDEVSEFAVDLYFGYKNLIDYNIGDKVQWLTDKSLQNGGRPEAGNFDGEGYTECPKCKKDFFVLVHIREDIIKSVDADFNKKPFIES